MSDSLSKEELDRMLDEMKKKLNIVNTSVLTTKDMDSSKHDDFKALHTHVMRQPSFSIGEMDEIVQELGNLRKA
ncbi:DUF1128 domain-containing protein [Shouchella shacheensis]|uniref:DUF1128 domain-containing protein n=1 Tax=Shouchella shacheensis TaxID=1649580 RepID=UPI00073FB4C1|nr:DUF1128 domain-containing protein [Shouchella shacheensis]